MHAKRTQDWRRRGSSLWKRIVHLTAPLLVLGACAGAGDGTGAAAKTRSGAMGNAPPLPGQVDLPPQFVVQTPAGAAGGAIGYVPGSGTVGQAGDFQYSIPLDVPPGASGHQPNLALIYSSLEGNGPLGRGWSLAGSYSAIAYCDKTLIDAPAPDSPNLDGNGPGHYDGTDAMCLDGAKLVKIGTDPWGRDEYRTEDDTLDQIIDGGGGFEVRTKDGHLRVYTKSVSVPRVVSTLSGFQNLGNYRTMWLLSDDLDRSGNKIHYEYIIDTKPTVPPGSPNSELASEVLVDHIDYWPAGGGSVVRSVKMVYDDRADPTFAYKNGVRTKSTKLLGRIEMWAPNPTDPASMGTKVPSRVWYYTLSYASGGHYLGLLSSVTKCGFLNDCLIAKRFGYEQTPPAFKSDTQTRGAGLGVFDVDGDGKDDVVYWTQGQSGDDEVFPHAIFDTHVRLSQGSNPVSGDLDYLEYDALSESVVYDGTLDNPTPPKRTQKPLDLANTGKHSVVIHYSSGAAQRRFAWNKQTQTLDQVFPSVAFTSHTAFADVDGDGHPDRVTPMSIELGTGGGAFAAPIATGQAAIANCGWDPMVDDIDGDGRMEAIFGANDTCTQSIAVGIADDAVSPKVISATMFPFVHNGMGAILADLNGDQLPDAVYKGNADVAVSWNTGNGFKPPVSILAGDMAQALALVPDPSKTAMMAYDINGDGRDDLLFTLRDFPIVLQGFGDYGVGIKDILIGFTSKGDGTFGRFDFPNIDPGMAILTGDFDGDGLSDLLIDDGAQYRILRPVPTFLDVMTRVYDGPNPAANRLVVTYAKTNPKDSASASCSSPQVCVRKAMPVVESIGGLDSPDPTFYHFEDPRRDLRRRESLLFGKMVIWQPARPMQRTVTFDRSYQDGSLFPGAGKPATVTEVIPVVDHLADDGVWSSPPAAATARVTQTTYNYATRWLNCGNASCTWADGKTHFIYQSGYMRQEWEEPVTIAWAASAAADHITDIDGPGYGTAITQIATVAVDDFDNVTAQTVQTLGGVTRETQRQYLNNTLNWQVGLLANEKERSWSAGSPVPAWRENAYFHDPLGRLFSFWIQPNSDDYMWHIVTRTLNARGQVDSETRQATYEPLRTLSYEYDDLTSEGIFPSRITDGLQFSRWFWTHPAYGTTISEMASNGTSLTHVIDDLERPVSDAGDGLPTTSLDYTVRTELGKEAGVITTATMSDGQVAVAAIDQVGRLVETKRTSFDGQQMIVSDYAYDLFGRPVRVSRPGFGAAAASHSSSRYDSLDRIRVATAPDLAETHYAYQFFTPKNTMTITHPQGRVSETELDLDLRVVRNSEKNQKGWVSTTYTYDPFDQVRSATDDQDHVTLFTHDARGRTLSVTDANRGTTVFTYNSFGEVIKTTDSLLHAKVFHRDAAGRVYETISTSDGTATFSYHTSGPGIGRLQRGVSTDGTTVDFDYDGLGRLSQSLYTICPTHSCAPGTGDQFALGFTYDAMSRLDEVRYPEVPGRLRASVKRHYNAQGEVDRLDLSPARSTDGWKTVWSVLQRNEEDALVWGNYGNNLQAHRMYDAVSGRLKTLQVDDAGPRLWFDYVYWNDGRIANRTDLSNQQLARSEFYYYDELRRLKHWTVDFKGVTNGTDYGYDDLGNLTSRAVNGVTVESNSYTDPRPHALHAQGNVTFHYDGDGRMDSSSDGRSIEYTDFDLPRTISLNGAPQVDYLYDAGNARVRKESAAGTTIYVGKLYERRTQAGQVDHVFYIGGPDGTIAQDVFSEASGQDNLEYLHRDELGGVALVTDAQGKELQRFHYEPFGGTVDEHGDPPGAGFQGDVRLGFTGHRQEDEVGLIDMGGRVYSPQLHRFLTPDPYVVDPYSSQSFNPYSYALNDPVNVYDPTGYRFSVHIHGTIKGAKKSWDLSVPAADGGGLDVSLDIDLDTMSPEAREYVAQKYGVNLNGEDQPAPGAQGPVVPPPAPPAPAPDHAGDGGGSTQAKPVADIKTPQVSESTSNAHADGGNGHSTIAHRVGGARHPGTSAAPEKTTTQRVAGAVADALGTAEWALSKVDPPVEGAGTLGLAIVNPFGKLSFAANAGAGIANGVAEGDTEQVAKEVAKIAVVVGLRVAKVLGGGKGAEQTAEKVERAAAENRALQETVATLSPGNAIKDAAAKTANAPATQRLLIRTRSTIESVLNRIKDF